MSPTSARSASALPVAVFGATSGIAREVGREWMRTGRDLILIGRNPEPLRAEAADLAVRFGRPCVVFEWDLLDRPRHAEKFAALMELAPDGLGGLFFAPGLLLSESELERDAEATRRLLDVNLTEPIVVLNLFARELEKQRGGFLSVLSSVAGDRGRSRNKTYGASKAGLSAYLEGLRAKLHDAGVLVQTVKPGPVRTPMLAGYKGPSLLLAEPDAVARDIVRGLARGKTTVYTPGYWRIVMGVVRALPEFIARRIPS